MTKSNRASTSGSGLQVMTVDQPSLDQRSEAANTRPRHANVEEHIADDKRVTDHVEESWVKISNPRHASVEEQLQSMTVQDFVGYIYDVITDYTSTYICIAETHDKMYYEGSVLFKHLDKEEGLVAYRPQALYEIGAIWCEVIDLGFIKDMNDWYIEDNKFEIIQTLEMNAELSDIQKEVPLDKHRKNVKENNRREYLVRQARKRKISPGSDNDMPDNVYVPHSDERPNVVRPYLWESRRLSIHTEYDNFIEHRRSVQLRSNDCKRMFDLIDVVLSKLSAQFDIRILSTLPGPPMYEDKICELVLLDNDSGSTFYAAFGWHLPRGQYNYDAIKYFSYWYHHYGLYLTRDQVRTLAFPTPNFDISPHAEEQRDDVIEEMLEALDFDFVELAQSLHVDTPSSNWLFHVENIVLLGYQLSQSKSFSGCVTAVLSYIKLYIPRESAITLLAQLLKRAPSCDYDDITPHSFSQHAVDGWTLFKSNKMYSRIAFLITAAMSLSICSMKELKWSVGCFDILSLEVPKHQLSAVDLIDAVVKTYAWIADVGWRIFKTGDLRCVLFEDQRMTEFNEKADYVLAYIESAAAGNLPNMNDYEAQLDKALSMVVEMKKSIQPGPAAVWMTNKYVQLVAAKERIIAKHRTTAIRFAPIGFSLSGSTSVGKSTLAKLTMKTSLYAMDFDSSADRIITYDNADKYQSTYTSDINGMFIDDFANLKSKFQENAPTAILIKFFNNVAAQAIKAEIGAKGNVFINFKCGVITSNVQDLDVRQYSNCPESILRRFYHVEVTILPKYTIPGTGMLNPHHPDLRKGELTMDVWNLSMYEVKVVDRTSCIQFGRGDSLGTYEFVPLVIEDYRGQQKYICEKMTLTEYLDVVVWLSQQHKRSQDKVVERSLEFDNASMCAKCKKPSALCKNVCWCKMCDMLQVACPCLVHPRIEPHSLVSNIVYRVAWDASLAYLRKKFPRVFSWYDFITFKSARKMTTEYLSNYLDVVLSDKVTEALLLYTPAWIERTRPFKYVANRILSTHVNPSMLFLTRWFPWIVSPLIAFSTYRNPHRGVCLAGVSMCTYSIIASACKVQVHAVRNEYLKRRDALPIYAKTIRDFVVPGATVVAATVIIVKAWNKLRLRKQIRNTQPNSILDYKAIDNKPGWMGYFSNTFSSKVNAPEISKTTLLDNLMGTLEKNLFYGEFSFEGRNIRCNVVFPRKGVMMFPEHIFYPGADFSVEPDKEFTIVVTRRPGSTASKFTSKVAYEQCVRVPGLDLMFAYIPNSPDIKDCSKWLPNSVPIGSVLARFIVRDRDCNLDKELVNVTCGKYGHKYRPQMYGGEYKTTNARNGACMGILVSHTKEPCILGFHIGGNSTSGVGVMQSLTVTMYEDAVRRLSEQPGVLLSSHAGVIPHAQYDIPLITTTAVHPKAKFLHALDPTAYLDVIGSTKLRSEYKTKVCKSILSDAITEITDVPNRWGGPHLVPNWKAYNESLEYIIHPADMHSPMMLERARQDWIRPLLLKMKDIAQEMTIRKLTLRESVMGIEGLRFLDPMPMQTSVGFPLFGPKTKYFCETRVGERLIDRRPSAEIINEMQRLERCWRRGERGYPVASATLKDEPTLVSKTKVRVFEAVAVAFGMHIRKYFLPIARFLSINPVLTECAVGVNCFSPDWDILMSHVETYDSEQLLAWDYSKYDLRMNSQMTRAVLLSYIELAQAAGYSQDDLYIMEQMVNDIVHPLMDYNGTLLMVYNMNTSGNNITVNINSTANSLYVRMALFHTYPQVDDFRSVCALMTYGDDGIASVHKDYRDFNIQTFIAYMKLHNMKVTLPTKDDRHDKFLYVQDVDFLKRKSKYIPEIQCRIGMLDEMSIFKSLHSNLRSTKVTPEEVAISVLESAMHEWFAHGREVYETRMNQMQSVCTKVGLPVNHMFVSYDERARQWLERYRKQETEFDHVSDSLVDDYSQDVVCTIKEQDHITQDMLTSEQKFVRLQFPENNEYEQSVACTKNSCESLTEPEQSVGMDFPIYPHAEEVQQYTEMPVPDSQKVNNVMFEDARPGYMEVKDGSMDALREAPLIQDATLQDFFSRPLKIGSYRWGVGSAFFEDLDPWSLYFNNPRVVNRISNYKLLHAKLHVKIIINGTPFHYGRLLASYTPLPLTDQMTRNVALINADLVAASQRPHIYINPTSSIGGEMVLPFFLPQNLLDVTYYDWRLLGNLNIRSIQNLKHANGAVDTVTVSVFAWSEEVKMAIPTQFEPGTIVPQADEYGDKPISKIASAAAAMMTPLMMIPTIAPFARATQIGASAVSSIAKLYGYAKTPLLDYQVRATTNTKYHWACTDIFDYVNKMTVDSKQELTVDPRSTGLDSTDEMALLNIVKRESYLYSFPWEIGDLEESLLFNVVVDPCIFRSYDNGTNREIHMPACCYGAYPFKYWRGTMRYRFQVVCSNFHRGRIKIVYDPTSGTAVSEYNVAYTTIVDISDKTDFTIDIGWGQPYTFKQHINFVNNSINTVLNTTTLPYSNSVTYGNGVLSVYVVNELTVPDTTINNDIQINVFVSACDDFEVAAPETIYMKHLRLTPPPAAGFAAADIEPQSEEVVEQQDSKPTNPETLAVMAKSILTQDATDAVHFGERILSFRQLAKRYDWHESVRWTTVAATPNYIQWAIRRNMFPYFPGFYTLPVSSITEPVDGSNYAYSNFTWLHYITCAYAGWKGGIRYTVDPKLLGASAVLVHRTSSGAPVSAVTTYTLATSATLPLNNATFHDNFMHVGQGAIYAGSSGTANFEVPYYNIERFTPARNRVQYTEDDAFMEKFVYNYMGPVVQVPATTPTDFYVAGAEDFSTYFFLGAPIFYYEEGRPS
ncbi:hypothetical protein [Lindernia crustacea marnavirus]|nr:hypothetical protein [Lindernia crustacea marnavirus]